MPTHNTNVPVEQRSAQASQTVTTAASGQTDQVLGADTQVDTALLAAQSNQFADPTDPRFQIAQSSVVPTATAQPNYYVADQARPSAQVHQRVGISIPTVDPALIGQGAGVTAAQDQQLTAQATAQAAIQDLPEEFLVSSQLEELTQGIQDGNIPTWAQPAADAVEAQLAARGLTRSSVGQAALTNAIIQAATPLAQGNAQALQQNFSQNLSNQQQANLQTAAAGQQLQLQNLTNQQQANLLRSQQQQQVLLSDQAAQNASRQFNATNQIQVQQFQSNLAAQIDLNNAARVDAMEQFNVAARNQADQFNVTQAVTASQFNAAQSNAMSQFNANLQFNSGKFNAENATLINQSNLNWRRQLNTINTAEQNQNNRINAQNAYNLQTNSLNQLWQEVRDHANWVWQGTQNDKQLATQLAIANLNAAAQQRIASQGRSATSYAALGGAAFNLISNWDDLTADGGFFDDVASLFG